VSIYNCIRFPRSGASSGKRSTSCGRGVIVYPTDSCYALGCHIGDKAALDRIREIRQTDRNHHFTLVCRDLADVGKYAVVDNSQYRLLRAHTPGLTRFSSRPRAKHRAA